ncbi:MAG: YciI family protein [Candidatus Dormibacteraeota bacterium]|nr:YciI family protein [Candidatus Dormibacteraeota bacterium]
MKYMLMFIDNAESHPGMAHTPEGQEIYGRIGQWFDELAHSGRFKSAEELQPVQTATTIRFDKGNPIVMDGPFVESKETVGGFAVIEAADLDEAIDIAKGWPGGGPVEVRPCVDHSPAG